MKELNQCYEEMLKHFFKEENKQSSSCPELTFLFASPGAGKTTYVRPKISQKYPPQEQPINLEIDELKAFIPVEKREKGADALIEDWFLKVVDKAIAEKRNLIITRQKNLLLPKQTMDIFKKAKENGYKTNASFLALDKERSRLGMIHRYEHALADYANKKDDIENYPRKPSLLRHYIFFKAIPIVSKACELSKYVDNIDVYDRQGIILSQLDKSTKTKSRTSPLRAILKERDRDWNYLEKNKFNRRTGEVIAKMSERGAGVLDVLKFKFLVKTSKNQKD